MIIAAIGTIVRALPTTIGLEAKVATADGPLMLEVPASRDDLIAMIRAARMSGAEMTLRHTADNVLVGVAIASDAIAA